MHRPDIRAPSTNTDLGPKHTTAGSWNGSAHKGQVFKPASPFGLRCFYTTASGGSTSGTCVQSRSNEMIVATPYAISRPETIKTAIRTCRMRNRWDNTTKNSTVASTTVVRM
jgi:hypothetical protein